PERRGRHLLPLRPHLRARAPVHVRPGLGLVSRVLANQRGPLPGLWRGVRAARALHVQPRRRHAPGVRADRGRQVRPLRPAVRSAVASPDPGGYLWRMSTLISRWASTVWTWPMASTLTE